LSVIALSYNLYQKLLHLAAIINPHLIEGFSPCIEQLNIRSVSLNSELKMAILKKPSYRLIIYSSSDAATNMATDEAILEAHLNSLVPPTLRLYQFSPPAVSFGYAQSLDQILQNRIKSAGFDTVRRPTGGRAVLHFGDLTYAFICSGKGSPIAEYGIVSDSVATAYKQICQGLILFLDSLGITVTFGQGKNNYRDKHDCFLATSEGDLQYQGQKLIGSAQLRRKHGVLQHGSIILNQPQTLMHELINDGSTDPNHKHHANLYEIAKNDYSIKSLEKDIVRSFEQAFACRFIPKELTPYEQNLVNKLKKKYQHIDKLN
jgi:lipoate-protein ligase A